MFPTENGVSPDLSPRAIVTGLQADYAKNYKLEFGQYVQTHEEHDNSMESCTTGAIGVRPTGKEQGGYYFFSLSNGRLLRHYRWTELSTPQDMIDRVYLLARRSRANKGLIFGDIHNQNVLDDFDDEDDSSDEEDFDPDDGDEDDDDHDLDVDGNDEPTGAEEEDEGDEKETDEDIGGDNDPNNDGSDVDEDEEEQIQEAAPDEIDEIDIPSDPINVTDEEDAVNDTEEQECAEQEEQEYADATNDDAEQGVEHTLEESLEIARPGEDEMMTAQEKLIKKYERQIKDYKFRGYNARRRKRKSIKNSNALAMKHMLEHVAMTQLNVKQGLKKFGQAGSNAVKSELEQLDYRDVLEPKDAKKLTRKQKTDALIYLMFLKKAMW